MIVTMEIGARLMQTLEAPTTQLTSKRFELGLTIVLGADLGHERMLIYDLPCTAMRLPANSMVMLGIRQNPVQLGRKVVIHLL
jgi:hypothetical protein